MANASIKFVYTQTDGDDQYTFTKLLGNDDVGDASDIYASFGEFMTDIGYIDEEAFADGADSLDDMTGITDLMRGIHPTSTPFTEYCMADVAPSTQGAPTVFEDAPVECLAAGRSGKSGYFQPKPKALGMQDVVVVTSGPEAYVGRVGRIADIDSSDDDGMPLWVRFDKGHGETEGMFFGADELASYPFIEGNRVYVSSGQHSDSEKVHGLSGVVEKILTTQPHGQEVLVRLDEHSREGIPPTWWVSTSSLSLVK